MKSVTLVFGTTLLQSTNIKVAVSGIKATDKQVVTDSTSAVAAVDTTLPTALTPGTHTLLITGVVDFAGYVVPDKTYHQLEL